MALEDYRRKRDFSRTPEPSGEEPAPSSPVTERSAWQQLSEGHRFCVQMHRATRLHFDFRLEHGGVLLSWAVPRGPSLDPAARRLAVHVEDHPVDYGDFEGVIPSGYGAGTVMLWDVGTYRWIRESAEDPERQLSRGDIKFELRGTRLAGEFALVNMGARRAGDDPAAWLLLKKRDGEVVPGFDARQLDVSVRSGRRLEEIAADGGGDPRRTPPPRRGGGGRSPLPEPMLAIPVDQPFRREGWFFEIKYDGVRALIRVADGTVTVMGRKGRDETARYPEVAAVAHMVRVREAVLDAEIVVLDAEGRPSFERLQSRLNLHRSPDIRRAAREVPVSLVVFDLLSVEGRDLTETALRIRKKTLRDILVPGRGVLIADHVETDGVTLFDALRARGLEGMIAKRADSPYRPGRRSPDWLKVKAWLTQSCAICGFTTGRGRRGRLGALILGVWEDGRLVHCGQVGGGLDEETLRLLTDRLASSTVTTPTLEPAPATAEPATWVRPELVCEVRHAGWTSAGHLRHPTFRGMRPDLGIDDCTRESSLPLPDLLRGEPSGAGSGAATAVVRGRAAPGASRPTDPDSASPARRGTAHWDLEGALEQLAHLRSTANWEVAGRVVHLTNLDKVLWPDDGITKRDMVGYYVRMAPLLVPYLRDRPLSMQVFPDGITGKSFWRKDKPGHAPDWIRSWTYRGEKVKEYIVVDEPATLAWVANAGVIDLHPWHSRVDAPDLPDWAVFDLDPFEPASFTDVVDIARLVRAALDHFGMRSVLKTSGQTGLQVYVPLRRGPDYAAVRGWVEEVGRAIGLIEPGRITWEWSVARRRGRIRIDYTQNIINKTLAAPYSLRPAPGAPVSTPLRWEELDDRELRPNRWTMSTIAARVAEMGDLFADLLSSDQSLPASQ